MPRILPPGVSEQKFLDALHAFSEIVGEKWVSTDDAAQQQYTIRTRALQPRHRIRVCDGCGDRRTHAVHRLRR
jgi:hypothetical protein